MAGPVRNITFLIYSLLILFHVPPSRAGASLISKSPCQLYTPGKSPPRYLSGYYQAGGTQVNPDWEVFGLNPDQQKALKTQITKEGVFGKFFPDVDVDLGERVTATPKSYNIEDFIIGTQGNMNVEEVVQRTQEAPVLTLDDLASQYGLGGGLQ